MEIRDLLTFGAIIFGCGVTIATLKSDSRAQSAQHASLKEDLTTQIKSINASVIAVAGDSRDHGARIIGLEGRMDRVEVHVDQIGRDLGVGRRA